MDALTPARLAARLRHAPRPDVPEPVPRPDGILLWLHALAPRPPDPLLSLARRVATVRGPVRLLLTTAQPGARDAARILQRPAPPEDPAAIARFLAHWRPDAALWQGDCHAPLLLDAASRAGVPLFLIEAAPPPAERALARRVRRLLLGRFRAILARDAAAAAALRRLGLASPPIELSGPLTLLPPPLPCAESDREDFAGALGARPVWLAMMPGAAEIETVIAAHRTALRTAHRLLLLLVPAQPDQGADLSRQLRAEGWSVARRGAEEMPGHGAEVYVADTPEELGLWYRLAPVCFLGGTLSGGAARDPGEAAALGSALIAGPAGGPAAAALDRLDEAGALRRIGGPEALARAVTDLLAPDRAAALAHRAWDVHTDGIGVEERLAGLILDAIPPRQS
jgi:3-deoxy-D-manno-octulosonic-acid transferase